MWVHSGREIPVDMQSLIDRWCSLYAEIPNDPECNCGNCAATQTMGKFCMAAVAGLMITYGSIPVWTAKEDMKFSMETYNLFTMATILERRLDGFSFAQCWEWIGAKLPVFLWQKFTAFEACTHEN